MNRIVCFLLVVFYAFCACTHKECVTESPVDNIILSDGHVYYEMNQLETPFKVMFLSDTHFTIEDERGKSYYQYSKRMGGSAVEPENYGISNGCEQALIASLEQAKQDSVDLVILGGDIINFPSAASVDSLMKIMVNSGLKWTYISGNHDWHYEGEPGNPIEQRNKWECSVLKPLYQGENPLYYAKQLRGVNFVFIDNSTNEILPEQLSFLQQEIKRGLPIIMIMHIPMYLPGQNIDYGCGNPNWNRMNDVYYEIERREPWPENGHSRTTYEFRDLLIKTPCIIGIFAGHTHEEKVDFFMNKIQYVTGANYGKHDVTICFNQSMNSNKNRSEQLLRK